MKHLSSIVLAAAVVAAGAVACFKDPTSSLRNGASRIELTRSSAFLNVGDSLAVQAEVKDDQGNTFDLPDATWTTSDAAVAVVNPDTSKFIPYNAFSKAFIRTTGAGQAWVFFASHGLKDSVQVYGLPPTFLGTVVAPANPTNNDTITVNATAPLTFNTSAATPSVVTYGTANLGTWLISRTATQIRFVPKDAVSAGATIHISNVMLSGVVRITSLNATTLLTNGVVFRNEPGNDALATATAITIPTGATAANPFIVYGRMTSADASDYFTFTLAAPAAVHAVLAWFGNGDGAHDTDPDLDLVICGPAPAACGYGQDLIPGNAASSAVQPETGTTGTLAAGTYVMHVLGYTLTSSTNAYMIKLNLQ
jgi:hypothetical protein